MNQILHSAEWRISVFVNFNAIIYRGVYTLPSTIHTWAGLRNHFSLNGYTSHQITAQT